MPYDSGPVPYVFGATPDFSLGISTLLVGTIFVSDVPERSTAGEYISIRLHLPIVLHETIE